MKHIGVLTSGGDAPGMNAAIRAVVRTALAGGVKVTGIMRGFSGLLERECEPMTARSVSNIIQLGGTILKTSRCKGFYEEQGRVRAAGILAELGIDCLIGIGGDGTFHGLYKLASEHGIAVIGVPGTIDNDIAGTEYTIGFSTAANTALESIDKLRDTAASHDRIFFIEVMGRNCGALALEVGLAGGAEGILIPEVTPNLERLSDIIREGRQRGKGSFIIVVAEGALEGGATAAAAAVKERTGVSYRVSVLGHVQRGGSPTSSDRTLASRMGRAAVVAATEGKTGVMIGIRDSDIVLVPLEETWTGETFIDLELLGVAEITAT
ncbi:6-phosphofructokinase [bacterium]|nr:6-phosphofructokinase [bacterium]